MFVTPMHNYPQCARRIAVQYNITRRFLLCQAFSEDFFYNCGMTIGQKIKELRIENNLSQMQLSKSIGVSQKAVDYWERGINEPKASYIMALVRFWGLTFDEFFADVD